VKEMEAIIPEMTVGAGVWSALVVLVLLFGGVLLGWLSDEDRSDRFRQQTGRSSEEGVARHAA
jgi:hypothetical protein